MCVVVGWRSRVLRKKGDTMNAGVGEAEAKCGAQPGRACGWQWKALLCGLP